MPTELISLRRETTRGFGFQAKSKYVTLFYEFVENLK